MKKIFTLIAMFALAVSAMASNQVLKVVNSEVKADSYGTQLFYRLPEAMVSGTSYTITAKVMFEKDLNEGLGFWPYAAGGSTQYTGFDKQSFTANEWTTITCNFTASGDHTFLQFPIGHVDGTMYIDDVVLVESGSTTNLVNNGGFDEEVSLLSYSNYGGEGNISPDTWWSWSWASPVVSMYTFYDEGEEIPVVEGNQVLKIVNAEVKADTYGTQLFYRLPEAMVSGTSYTITAKVMFEKDLNEGLGFWPYAAGGSTQYTGFDKQSFTANEWTTITCNFTASGDHTFLQFPIGHVDGTMYLDDVVLTESGSTTNLVNNGNFDEAVSHLSYSNYGGEDNISPDTWWSWSWALPTVSMYTFVEEGDATAIESVVAKQNNVMYNLAGQRINKANGLYIVNGKKYVK